MEYINRPDGTRILIDSSKNEGNLICFIFGGFGYTPNHPLLYYEHELAFQYGFSVYGIDLEYSKNELFIELSDEDRDLYFEKDIDLLIEYIEKYNIGNKLFIGKSLGTSIINRLICRKVISPKDKLIILTPGSEWSDLLNNIIDNNICAFIVGGLADKIYRIEDLDKIHNCKNIKVLEIENGDHSLEIDECKKNIEILQKVIQQSEEYMLGKSV